MDQLVSILIPAYNAEKWIKDTIESAIQQTWPRVEIIIVDDGSSDKTPQILRKYESSSVRVITQENMGGPAARNKALNYAQGDFIQWLDHDDLLAPDKISNQLRNRGYDGNTRVLLSGAFGTFYFRKEKAKIRPGSLWKDLEPIEYFLIKFMENTFMHPSVWLISRKLTDMAGPWLEARNPDDDGEYFCRVVATSEKILFVSEAKSYWRIGNLKSMSQNKSDEALEALSFSIIRCINQLRILEDSKRTRDACLNYLQLCISAFYPEKTDVLKKLNDLASDLGGTISPKESNKFFYIRKVVGWKIAKKIKQITWNIGVLARRNVDRLLYILNGR